MSHEWDVNKRKTPSVNGEELICPSVEPLPKIWLTCLSEAKPSTHKVNLEPSTSLVRCYEAKDRQKDRNLLLSATPRWNWDWDGRQDETS
jgi:hypothetical protein